MIVTWKVWEMFYKVMVSNFFLEHIFLVEEQDEGCVLKPILELNLSEYFYWLLQSVRSLVVFSDEVGVVLVDGCQEDDAGHSLLRLHYYKRCLNNFHSILLTKRLDVGESKDRHTARNSIQMVLCSRWPPTSVILKLISLTVNSYSKTNRPL